MSQRRSSDYEDDIRYSFEQQNVNREFPNIFDLREDFEDNFAKSDLTDDELIGYSTVKQLLDKIARKV